MAMIRHEILAVPVLLCFGIAAPQRYMTAKITPSANH
jgi:hypothetical protein